MSDWENMDEDNIQIKKADGFEDEKEVVTVDVEKSTTKEEPKPLNPEKKKAKDAVKNYEKKYQDKQVKYNDALQVDEPKRGPKPTADERRKGEEMSKQSDLKNTFDLLEGLSSEYKKEMGILENISLKNETEAKDLAKKLATALAKPVGSGINNQEFLRIHIKDFFCDLLQEVSPKLSSKEFNEILTKVKVLFNAKEKEEKDKEKSKKSTKGKPSLNAGKSTKTKTYNDDDDDDDEYYEEYDSKFNDNDFM